MNKNLIKNIGCLFLVTGCSGVSYHQETDSINLKSSMDTQVRPMEAKVKVSEPIQGRSECTSTLFGLFKHSSGTEAYGADINVEGNAPSFCAKEAVYDAVTKNKADVIVAPRYQVMKNRFICFGNACLYKKYTVSVKGFKGTYYDIKDMDEDIVKEYYKSQLIKKN